MGMSLMVAGVGWGVGGTEADDEDEGEGDGDGGAGRERVRDEEERGMLMECKRAREEGARAMVVVRRDDEASRAEEASSVGHAGLWLRSTLR